MSGATPNGTQTYAKKFSNYQAFYQASNDLLFSKLGLGTYVMEPYKEENYLFSYKESVKRAIEQGINHIDSASNYRYGQSEKEIGEAIKELIDEGKVTREELIITSKGGFIQLEFPFPKNPYQWIQEHLIEPKRATKEDVIIDQHCLTADFIEFSLERSLDNLGVDTIDIYYVHNPEMELGDITNKQLLKKLKSIFEMLEQKVKEGKINYYGLATWNGLLNQKDDTEYLSLQEIVDLAIEVGGENHHFKYLQAPFNLAKPLMISTANQMLHDKENYTLINAAKKLGLDVVGSSSLLQMNLFKRPFSAEVGYILDKGMKLESDIQLALQFSRSTPGLLSSLFGSTDPEHVEHNVAIATVPAVSKAAYDLLFRL
jgi:aryl-alcohol dehydrogenase-like predicted oxidoreductase